MSEGSFSDQRPLFSVAICTWNRAPMLRRTLESLCELQADSFQWELVLVDNNCTDDTSQVCETFADRLPIRSVSEPQQGHSHARNRAIDEARGDFIAWTDDDVQVDRNWLVSYADAIEAHSSADFFGGEIVPKFDSPPPGWIKTNWDICKGVYAARDFGDKPFQITEKKRLPFGANMVIRRELQMQNRYSPKFGRQGKRVRGFDEIDVLNRLLEQGHEGWWVPTATIDHTIPADRATLDYVADYFRGQGQTWALRGLSQTSAVELNAKYRQARFRYWINRIWSSRIWFPFFAQTNNLLGQLDIVAKTE